MDSFTLRLYVGSYMQYTPHEHEQEEGGSEERAASRGREQTEHRETDDDGGRAEDLQTRTDERCQDFRVLGRSEDVAVH